MTIKPSVRYVVAMLLLLGNAAGFGFAIAQGEPTHAAAHAGLCFAFWFWAQRLREDMNEDRESDAPRLQALLERQTAQLEDARAELAELRERVDFAERLLTQARERSRVPDKEGRA